MGHYLVIRVTNQGTRERQYKYGACALESFHLDAIQGWEDDAISVSLWRIDDKEQRECLFSMLPHQIKSRVPHTIAEAREMWGK